MVQGVRIRTKYGDIVLRVIRTPPNQSIKIEKTANERIFFQKDIQPKIYDQKENKLYIFPLETEYVFVISEQKRFKLFVKIGCNPDIDLENAELTKIANFYKETKYSQKDRKVKPR